MLSHMRKQEKKKWGDNWSSCFCPEAGIQWGLGCCQTVQTPERTNVGKAIPAAPTVLRTSRFLTQGYQLLLIVYFKTLSFHQFITKHFVQLHNLAPRRRGAHDLLCQEVRKIRIPDTAELPTFLADKWVRGLAWSI
jgi:hypothetical protein